MAQKLKRNINMGFRVDAEEKEYIDKKMVEAGWGNFRCFVLHCIKRGMIINLDLTTVREMNTLLRNISNNINQIAARANTTGNVHASDITVIQDKQSEIWEQQRKVIGVITKITEVGK
jgi:hypothetical protein